MAWTRHGHQIEGTEALPRDEKPPTARCGGPKICANCALDVARAKAAKDWHEDISCYNEFTLIKVHEALYKAGLTKAECTEAIDHMQQAGILFREKLPYI